MKNNKGLTLVSLVITIIVLLILAGVSLNVVLGENGILNRATTVEETFNKSEVLEELNILVTEKYIAAYNKASQANDVNNMSNYFSGQKVINFLLGDTDDNGTANEGAKVYIEQLNGYTNTNSDSRYFIIINSLGRNIENYGIGENNIAKNDYFFLKAVSDAAGNVQTIKVFYKNLKNVEEEIGDLVLTPSL